MTWHHPRLDRSPKSAADRSFCTPHWQWLRARRNPARFEESGPVGTAINMVIFLAHFLTPWYARAVSFTSDAALVFYGCFDVTEGARF